jgi:hypothetical protein
MSVADTFSGSSHPQANVLVSPQLRELLHLTLGLEGHSSTPRVIRAGARPPTAKAGYDLGHRVPEGLARESAVFLVPGGPGVGCSADCGMRRCLLHRWIPLGPELLVWV